MSSVTSTTEESDNLSPTAELFPIRELSQRCSVNTVTIRAWERRYGLLKPQRTSKGHRLYSDDDVVRVEQILAWMARGVPVGRVKELLESKNDPETQIATDDWQQPVAELIESSGQFAKAIIQSLLHNTFLNYPVSVCQENLIDPTMASLLSKERGMASYHYLQSEIISYALHRLNSPSKKSPGETLLLIGGEKTAMWRLALMAIELNDANTNVEMINQACSVEVWLALVEANRLRHCIVYQDGIWREQETKQISASLTGLPHVSLCGTAPMTSNICGNKRLYESPRRFLDNYLNK